jgi:hypothetical protein
MSTRDTGSETWSRFASFPGDNLDLGNAPEEDDVDHRTEPPSWLSGAAAVGTGAGPPDADTDDDHDGGQPNAAGNNVFGSGNDNAEAPPSGGNSTPSPNFGAPSPPVFGDGHGGVPDFGEITTGAHDFGNVPSGRGYGDNGTPDFNTAPDGPPDFGATRGFTDAPPPSPSEAPDFTGAPAPGSVFGGSRAPDPLEAPAAGGYGAPADTGQGYSGDQRDFGGDYHQGDYRTGYGSAQAENQFGGDNPFAGDGQFGNSPYGGPQSFQPGQDTFQPGQENGATTQAPPFPSQYPPVDSPGRSSSPSGRMTASLRTVRRPKSSGKPGRKRKAAPGRQAQLTVARVEPWSVMKFSFVISLVAFIVFFVAVAVLYAVLSGLGVFSALQHTVTSITSSQSSGGFNLSTYLSASRVLGYTGLLGAVNVVLITALSTVGSVLYNITADLAGGVEITLKETD